MWPPPRWRTVIRPCALRPALLFLMRTSLRSGRFLLTPAKSDSVVKRSAAVFGLYVLRPMSFLAYAISMVWPAWSVTTARFQSGVRP